MSKNIFAQQQLKKHGWNDEKGLGRLENGMKDAIKVKVKNNKGGLGHDPGSEFTFHWWDHIFNKAANSIKVSDDKDGVKIEKDENAKKLIPKMISTTKPLKSIFQGKPLLYGTFVKSGTYHNDEETKEASDSDSSDDEDFSSKDTLEKTFKMTGLTGHKAARHGHQLSGKLQRIQEQENKSKADTNNDVKSDTSEKKKKKKRKLEENDSEITQKKKKKNCKERENMNTVCQQTEEVKTQKEKNKETSKKKSKKNKIKE